MIYYDVKLFYRFPGTSHPLHRLGPAPSARRRRATKDSFAPSTKPPSHSCMESERRMIRAEQESTCHSWVLFNMSQFSNSSVFQLQLVEGNRLAAAASAVAIPISVC